MSDERATGDGAVFEGESLAPAVTRAAAIMDLLAENGSVPAGPSELARRLGLPKSSIANICAALADTGLDRRGGTGFTLGRKLAELGGAYLTSVDLVQEFYEACTELPTGSEETVQLAVLDVTPAGFALVERAPGVSVEQVVAATAAKLRVPGDVPEMKV